MKNLFLVNPCAGKGDGLKKKVAEIEAYCAKNSVEYEIYYTKAPLDGIKFLKEYLAKDDHVRVYAFGGDGTLFEAINAAAEFENAEIGIFPLGSGNDFVRVFNDKTKFLEIENQLEGEAVVLDMMKCNNTYAISQCSMGMDAETCANQVRFKKIPLITGETAFQLSAVYCLLNKMSNEFTIKVDDEPEYTKELLFCLGANSRWYGGGYKGAPDALPNDGYIDLVTIEKVSKLKLLGLLGKYKKGEHKDLPITTIKRCKKVVIKAKKEAAVNVDGECFYTHETEFEIVPNKIKFIIPKGCHMMLD
ncbi:MAG: YegS/Rv2252/BmrU family lipid kinase [Clostridia bacterium]